MLDICPANKNQFPEILKILKDLDLYYQDHDLSNFWTANDGSIIVGLVKMNDYMDFAFLGSLGVAINSRNRGIARQILTKMFDVYKKDIYIYTVIPDFFEKFGFMKISTPNNLPPKDNFECKDCFPDKCATMVRTYDKSIA